MLVLAVGFVGAALPVTLGAQTAPRTLAGRYVTESVGGWYTLDVSQDGEKDGAKVKAMLTGAGTKVEMSGRLLVLSYLEASGEAKIDGAPSPNDRGAFQLRSNGDGVLLAIEPGVPKDWNRFSGDAGQAWMRQGGLAERAYRADKEAARAACLATGGDCARACEDASAAGCFGAALQQEGGVRGEPDVAALLRAHRRACSAGVASSCYRLATKARQAEMMGHYEAPGADGWTQRADSLATATLGTAR